MIEKKKPTDIYHQHMDITAETSFLDTCSSYMFWNCDSSWIIRSVSHLPSGKLT